MKKYQYSFWCCIFGIACLHVFIPNLTNAQESLSYVFRLGKDTVAFEQYKRNTESIEGSILSIYPSTRVIKFRASLNEKGYINGFRSVSYNPVTTSIDNPQSIRNVIFLMDSIKQEYIIGGKIDTNFSRTFPIGFGAVPSLDNDIAMYEQMLKQQIIAGQDSISISRFTSGLSRSYIKKNTENIFESRYFFYPVYLKTNELKQIESLDATATTIKTIATISRGFDFNKMVKKYVEQEKQKGASGFLSPSDTSNISFDGARLQLTYGRPSKRGRIIFGEVVPWKRVWRLGADYATHFSTNKDLQFEGITIPAGRYTLWLVPSVTDSSEIIFNNRINIFGTQYDPKQNLARIKMSTKKLSKEVEQLLIFIQKENAEAKLVIQWDKMEFSIPFSIK